MLTIIQSNRLEGLADILADRLFAPVTENPFASDKVIVQSPGMSQWLKLVIAQRNGICGNVEFPLPSSFIWRLYQACIADLPEKSAFNKPDMAWKIHELLPQVINDEAFTPLAHYLASNDNKGEGTTESENLLEDSYFRRFQLAEKIADVYDQYLVYRPEWILQWEEAMTDGMDKQSMNYYASDAIPELDMHDHRWQPMLWRSLVAYSDELQQKPYHRANMHHQLIAGIAELDGNTAAAQKMRELLPERLFIFGISALPLQQLQVFEALSAHIPVFIFQFNPCAHYWGDIVDEKRLAKIRVQLSADKQREIHTLPEDEYHQVGNPLLASLGKLGRDYFDMLLATDAMFLDAFVEESEQSESLGLLQSIQQDVFDLSFRGQVDALSASQLAGEDGIKPIALHDNTLIINSCHSPLRECEVLQDHLLALFEEHADLSPRDVLVMMPDVGQYSPAIEAVFNSQQEGMRIPFAISDRGITQENPLISSFLQLLQLPESRFTTSELFTLLEVPAVHQHIGLDETDLPKLQHWVREAGVRWGLDAQHKTEYNLPAENLNTWAFGIQRLLLGYAVNTEQLTDKGVPYVEIEGQDTELLGRLLQFIQRLVHYRQALAPVETLAEKIFIARQLIMAFYEESDESQQGIQAIRDALVALELHVKNGNAQEPISHKVFFHCVQQELSEKGVGQRFLAGAVNFCTLMPMRSIPFKVICLLGMNERDYPRQVTPIGFDLVTQTKPKRGDRSRRLDDRYLFLEALLSARQQLYISFVGRSLQDNQPKLPSIVVSELIDYCNQGFSFDGKSFEIQEHALQPFNRNYFTSSVTNANALDNEAAVVDGGKTESSQNHWFSFQKHWLQFLQSSQLAVSRENVVQAPQMFGEPMRFDPQVSHIALDELLAFVQHPIRFYFQNTLSIRLEDILEEDNDDEAFQLDGLQRYQLQQQLIKERINNAMSAPQRFAVSRESGELPYQFVGEQQFQQLAEQSETFVQRLQEVWSTPLDPILVEQNITLAEQTLCGHEFAAGHTVQLTGWLYHCQQNSQLFYRPAKIKATQWLVAWIQHLVLAIQADNCATQMLSADSAALPTQTLIIGRDTRVTFPAISAEDALAALQPWLAAFVASKQRILHLLPETALAWLRKQTEAEMQKVFLSNSFTNVAGEGDDVYVKQLIRDFSQLPKDYITYCEMFLGPMWDHAQESAE